MKRLFTAGAICLLLLHFGILKAQEIAYPEKSLYSVSFTLLITGIEDLIGEVRIAVFDSESKYKEKQHPLYAVVLPVKGDTLQWSSDDMPRGEYAIAVYHDKNENGKLDSNILGIPKEDYGFSNDARGKFGPASWQDARFKISEAFSRHQIHIK